MTQHKISPFLQEAVLPTGSWPVMITPYKENLSIDWEGVDRLVEWYIQSGSSGLFAVCLSSEMLNLDAEERVRLAERIVKRVDGRVPVIASGVQCESLGDSAEMTRRIAGTGVSVVVCTASQFVGADAGDDEWSDAVSRYMEMVPASIPLGVYECPEPYHRLVTAKQLSWLAGSGRFVCMKDTSCAMSPIEEKLSEIREVAGFRFYNANVPTLVPSLRAGAHGFSGIGANFCPDIFSWICENFDVRKDLADELQDFLSIIGPLIVHKYSPSAKTFLRMQGMDILPYSRVRAPSFTEDDLRMLESLGRQLRKWREKLGLPDIRME